MSCYIVYIENRKPSPWRVLDKRFLDNNCKIKLGPFKKFNSAYKHVKALREAHTRIQDSINGD